MRNIANQLGISNKYHQVSFENLYIESKILFGLLYYSVAESLLENDAKLIIFESDSVNGKVLLFSKTVSCVNIHFSFYICDLYYW